MESTFKLRGAAALLKIMAVAVESGDLVTDMDYGIDLIAETIESCIDDKSVVADFWSEEEKREKLVNVLSELYSILEV